jgi:hypothetical protein
MWSSVLVLILLQASPAPASSAAPPPPPRSPWSTTSNLELVADERDSLKGVSRVGLTVQVPDALADTLKVDALTSTAAFQLEQAGLVVTPTRAMEDPLLSIAIRTVNERDARGVDTGRVVYRVYADLLQLVRLADRNGTARLMMASTWHAGSFGTLAASDADGLRSHISDVVATFLGDHRAVNAPAGPPKLTPAP